MKRIADLTTSKIIYNSIISTINAKHMCVYIKNLPLHTTRPTRIHAHTIFNVTRTHHKAVQLKRKGTKWICLRWDMTIHIRPTTSRCTYKQRPRGKPNTTWIFWIPPHSRIIATHHPPYFIFSGGRRLWSKIYQKSGRWSPHSRIEKKLRNIRRLDRCIILWYHTKVALWRYNTETICWYFNARLRH